jgi:uncharacterized membrane protein
MAWSMASSIRAAISGTLALLLGAGRVWAHHGAAPAFEGSRPVVVAVVAGALAFLAGIAIVAIVIALTRKPPASG